MFSGSATHLIQEILGGERTLGQRVSNEQDLIKIVRSGLPQAALEALSQRFDLSTDLVVATLKLQTPTSIHRMKQLQPNARNAATAQVRLSVDESDRLLRLAMVASIAVDILGGQREVSACLQAPNRALGGVTPLSRMDTHVGARQVESVLGRIEHGVFS